MELYCTNCGNRLAEDAIFCGKCGEPVTRNADQTNEAISQINESTYLDDENLGENRTSTALKTIGIIILAFGILGSLVLGIETDSFITFLIATFSCIISGTFFIGLGEIIFLLQKSVNMQSVMMEKMNNNQPEDANE